MPTKQVGIVMDDLHEFYEAKARRKVSSKLSALSRENKKLKKLEQKFKQELEKEVKKIKQKLERELKKKVEDKTKKAKSVVSRERQLKTNEMKFKLIEKELEYRIGQLEKVSQLKVKDFIKSSKSNHYTGLTNQARAYNNKIDSMKKKK